MDLNPIPKILVLSTAGQNEITQKAIELGADYYVVKPFDMLALSQRILQMFNSALPTREYHPIDEIELRRNKSNNINEINLEKQISEIIQEAGIPTHIKGYIFIKEALNIIVNDIEILSSISTEIYSSIAKKYNTTSNRVERAIQHAIEYACSEGEVGIINKVLGYTIIKNKDIPTNNEFIFSLLDKLKMKN
jgi:two-component system response regulator (stage 0 sporulation protein A)